jgi:hypothetical protein
MANKSDQKKLPDLVSRALRERAREPYGRVGTTPQHSLFIIRLLASAAQVKVLAIHTLETRSLQSIFTHQINNLNSDIEIQ